MKEDMPRFYYATPDAHIVLFIVLAVTVIAFIGLMRLQGREDKEQAERLRDPHQNLDRQVKLQLMKSDPEFYGRIFKNLE